MRNSNCEHIFGWGTSDWGMPGLFISLSYGAIQFKQGKYVKRYEYAILLN